MQTFSIIVIAILVGFFTGAAAVFVAACVAAYAAAHTDEDGAERDSRR